MWVDGITMTAMPTIALATAVAACQQDEDLAPLADACRRVGVTPVTLAWDDATVSWSRFDAIVLRSTWNYTQRLPVFLTWSERADVRDRLINPANVVRWNTDKRYLGDLASAGAPVIASHYLAPGDRIELPAYEEFVIKPCVGAGSRGARRFQAHEHDAAKAHASTLLEGGQHVLIQPYLERVDEAGETALLFYDGVFSHAIRKGPLLRRGQDATRALFAAEHIAARTPSDKELSVARHVLAALPFEMPTYARVDLLPSDHGPQLLELELIEPSMFFAHSAGGAERFAAALLKRLTSA